MIKKSNLLLLTFWFFVWGVIVLSNISTFGLWLPVPDPRSPALLLLSLFFYGPLAVVIASEILARQSGEQETRARTAVKAASTAFVVALGLYALVLAVYALTTL